MGLRYALEPLAEVVLRNRVWMTWNLILAAVPVALAVPVFRHRGPRGPLWWAGAALLVLFLPNAPYVVTDLVHLRGDVEGARSDMAVITGVLPVYGAFIAAGFVAYALVLREAGRWMGSRGLAGWRALAEVGIHAVCAVGVVLGRVARLNSWEPVTDPQSTLGRVVTTLSWRWTPVVVLGTFVVIWAGHAVTQSLARSAAAASAAVRGRLWTAVEHWLRLRPL